VFLLGVMGCQDLPWMKVPVGLSVLPDSLNGTTSAINRGIFETEQSAAEYGFLNSGAAQPPNSGKKIARDTLGAFIDHDDGRGPRLHFTEEEIRWTHKHFFLLQFARDEFVAKYSVKNHISPERLEQRR
jgi:hypothetical protein